MDIDVQRITAQRDKPLTRADIERLLHEVGSSNKLNLSSQNMVGIDLAKFKLTGADLSGADLSGAGLRGTNLSGAIMSEFEREQLRNRGILDLDDPYAETTSSTSTLRIRIIEEPLTPYNLTTIISALTELSTKYWLIAKGRFAELIEYTQTHNVRFAEEAGLVITSVTYNSPLDITLGSPNFDSKNIADAVITTIDDITQRKAKLEKAELENQAKAQEIKLVQQKAEQVQQMAALEREKQALEREKQRLALLQQQLDLQKKGIEYALKIAKKTVDLLHPNADDATKSMIIQAILPNILQLQNGKGLVLALPVPKNDEEKSH
jgi:uncharacterized protein YjbI with pentapeptide repeats